MTITNRARLLLGLLAGTLLLGAGVWWWIRTPSTALIPQSQIALDDPTLQRSPGWQQTADGLDPPEPADPWHEPAGMLHFTYTGQALWLQLAGGEYWAYLYATVDGEPANALPNLSGNSNSQGEAAGYKTLYAPEAVGDQGPEPRWILVHQAAQPGEHAVYLEFWRGWGQSPLRAITVDPVAPSAARWPAVALILAGLWAMGIAVRSHVQVDWQPRQLPWLAAAAHWRTAARPGALPAWLIGVLLVAAGVGGAQWWLTLLGLALIALAALIRPVWWLAALLFGLPFYFSFPLPILPGRNLGLIEIGLAGAIGLVVLGWLIDPSRRITPRWDWWVLPALASWALIAAFAAEHGDVALREWRTVFLAGAIFAWVLPRLLRTDAEIDWLLAAWLAGGTVVALVGVWQYVVGSNLISAEGVWRVRAFYGSPNNLALYIERTLAVVLAFVLFRPTGWMRALAALAMLIQGAALLLTFSKGALLLGLPAMLFTLWLGGWIVLGRAGQSRRLLWALAAMALLVALALLPFMATERFQRLLDFSQGTGFLRLNLWRSALQMALDHPLFGVGPDNFLYAYRSNYLLPAAWQEPNLNHPHNWPLDWWTRLGLPGLGLALLWLGAILVRLGRSVCVGLRPARSLGLLAASVAALAHGLIDASYALPDLMLVWVLCAALAALPEFTAGSARSLPPA